MRRRQFFKYRAKEIGVPFNLTVESLWKLWTDQEGKCALSGIPFNLTSSGGCGKRHPYGPSLDRKTPSKGYVISNVRWVLNVVNYGINAWGQDTFFDVCRAIVKIHP